MTILKVNFPKKTEAGRVTLFFILQISSMPLPQKRAEYTSSLCLLAYSVAWYVFKKWPCVGNSLQKGSNDYFNNLSDNCGNFDLAQMFIPLYIKPHDSSLYYVTVIGHFLVLVFKILNLLAPWSYTALAIGRLFLLYTVKNTFY